MDPILITTCTNRKTLPPAQRLQARKLDNGSQELVTTSWKEWLKEHQHRITARELYAGRGFSEALTTSKYCGSNLWIISAGIGLISADEELPAYDLTLSIGSPNNIRDKITKGFFDAALWWSDLGRCHRPKRSISNLVRNNPGRTVIICLPGSYMELIAQDLLALNDSELKWVRLIGPLPSSNLHERLCPVHMPYDDRLNGPDSPLPGTRADFPQRAARHFVEHIWLIHGQALPEKHSAWVENSITAFRSPQIPKRNKLTDEELVQKITKFWDRANGQSARMLRILRDEESIACEQGRFSILFKRVRKLRNEDANGEHYLRFRAVCSTQGKGTAVYSFFIPGEQITQIADISRIHRDDEGPLHGFQRKEIKHHVNSIVEYLDQGPVLFPNSIILALSPEVKFTQSRGNKPDGAFDSCQSGTLIIPIREEGQRIAWIVDGQQRSLALAKTRNHGLNVPVVAFVEPDLELQREQFILVNKAKPLPTRLINELLPEVDRHLPRDLSTRKLPSALCDLLNRDPDSPFHGIIKRVSLPDTNDAVVTDNAIIEMIKASLKNPIGALTPFKNFGTGPSDTDGMYQTLIMFWSAVKHTFPESWGKLPSESRLMHSAGIRAMGTLMDKIINRASAHANPEKHIHDSLARIAPHCRWTEGVWEALNLPWNEIQQTNRHIRQLSNLLSHLDYEACRQGVLS